MLLYVLLVIRPFDDFLLHKALLWWRGFPLAWTGLAGNREFCFTWTNQMMAVCKLSEMLWSVKNFQDKTVSVFTCCHFIHALLFGLLLNHSLKVFGTKSKTHAISFCGFWEKYWVLPLYWKIESSNTHTRTSTSTHTQTHTHIHTPPPPRYLVRGVLAPWLSAPPGLIVWHGGVNEQGLLLTPWLLFVF